MGTDIHSYFELRHGPHEPWQLVHRPEVDDEGWYDVPADAQPFRGLRSREFLVVLTGIISVGVALDYTRLTPIVPPGRPPPEDLSDELARIYAAWQGAASSPVALTLRNLEAVDWEQPVYSRDGSSQPLGSYAPLACDAATTMQRLARGRHATDVRLVFWLDS